MTTTDPLAGPADEIAACRADYPFLGSHGFGAEPGAPGCPKANLAARRAEMTDADHIEQFRRAVSFLKSRRQRRTVNTECHSYTWKHAAEKFHKRRCPGQDYYVSNGMLICAALSLGFPIERIQHSPNAFIGIGVPHAG